VRTALKYGTIMILTYLVVAYATGSGTVIDKATAGGSNVIKAFQGR
jgi:hypothetical protein